MVKLVEDIIEQGVREGNSGMLMTPVFFNVLILMDNFCSRELRGKGTSKYGANQGTSYGYIFKRNRMNNHKIWDSRECGL